MTKKQRHEVYKKALRQVEIKNFLNVYSICGAIKRTCFDKGNFISTSILLDEFPEFALFKPDDKDQFYYWFRVDDLQTRQIVIDFCILMTKTK